jgi:hypothetical protein
MFSSYRPQRKKDRWPRVFPLAENPKKEETTSFLGRNGIGGAQVKGQKRSEADLERKAISDTLLGSIKETNGRDLDLTLYTVLGRNWLENRVRDFVLVLDCARLIRVDREKLKKDEELN